MGASSKLTAPSRPLVPLAVGTVLVVIGTGLGLARHRDAHRQLRATVQSGRPLPSAGTDGFVPCAAALPAVPVTGGDQRRTVLNLGSMVVAVALLLGGLGIGFVGAAVASQRSAPTPAKASAEPPVSVALGRPVEAWQPKLSPVVSVDSPSAGRPTTGPPTAPAEFVLPPSRPTSLHIPAIGVQSPVHHLGQAADGSLETPQPGPRYNHAAWYRHSPTPGSLGPSILLGHVDSAAEGPSVFFRLGELAAGDRITVTRADDSVAVFRVDRVRRYAKDRFPAELVYGDLDHAGLRVITCGGAFDNASGHYLDNIVVFASLVRPPHP